MDYIHELEKKGFEPKIIVDFLVAATEKRTLTISERKYIFEYYNLLERKLYQINKNKNESILN